MNDKKNQNNGASLPQEKKTQLEIQIAELQQQEQQTQKQLKTCQIKAKKANNLANCLETADKFGKQFLADLAEREKAKKQPDNNWLEYLLKNKVEFAFKFAIGIETFAKLVSESVERQHRILQLELDHIQSQLQYEERKFARLEARRQGKVLLECEYRKSIGCFGEYQCQNCQVNYSVSENNQLKGGSY
ncbi:hypothetical protein [endosymbiont GvMRE of Glomus versiforme]|uniref:hypothetical protein n=1 Tax=endosymbiont GvMRE of Glomus versiforme TaxID=2039283 RepID=UPI000EE0601D|nr:hypothetical protein [endosymbiont GvMRE of Glomus versiforme]RHZ36187.1 hypothetical protein GvMRE_Ic2g106 [endosymbiont GvMRE of Glomus versiforme]RHZ36223.1 hypothetical protein GvMRE_Ic2g63 [endosymbiont GvMRE of Glomus versiforme]